MVNNGLETWLWAFFAILLVQTATIGECSQVKLPAARQLASVAYDRIFKYQRSVVALCSKALNSRVRMVLVLLLQLLHLCTH